MLLSTLLLAQNSTTDSLKTLLSSSSDSVKLRLLYKIGKSYDANMPDSTLKYLEKSISFYNNELSFKTDNCKKIVAEAYKSIGFIYKNRSEINKALEYYAKAEELLVKTKHLNILAEIYNNIGLAYYEIGNINLVIENLMKSLKLLEKTGDSVGTAFSLLNIGSIYDDQGDSANALKNYMNSYIILKKLNNEKGVSYAANNISYIYQKQKKYDLALKFAEESAEIAKKLDDKRGLAYALTMLGTISDALKDYDRAIAYYNECLAIREFMKDEKGKSFSLNNLAGVYYRLENYKKALEYNTKANDIAKRLGYPELIKNTSLTSSLVYKKIGKYKESLEAYELYINMRDSISNENNKNNNEQLNLQYQFEKREIELMKQKEVQEVQYLEQMKQQKIVSYGLGLIILMVVGFSFFLYSRFQIISKQKDIIEKQKSTVDAKNKEITDSINYASRIQNALLPSKNEFKKYFPEMFILYKPRDIVSGDFYWISMKHQNKIAIATVDCTGHGVPGGFMSMLGTSFLNEIVDERKVLASNLILDNLRDKIKQSLKVDSGYTNDGMDISLIVFNTDTLELEISAANNPVWIVPNLTTADDEVKVIEIKPDKMPVGFYEGHEKPFNKQIYQLSKGDIIYTFTDGYADQFGGLSQAPSLSRTKKYTYKRLREKLIAISQMPLAEQRMSLEVEFMEWKKGVDQLDDVLLMGFKA
jgi:tetratricopeptide (TPR) repeat protein